MTTRTSSDGLSPVTVEPGHPLSFLVRIDVDARSHTGHHRASNEDHFFVTRLGRTLQTLMTSLPAGAVPARTEEVKELARDAYDLAAFSPHLTQTEAELRIATLKAKLKLQGEPPHTL